MLTGCATAVAVAACVGAMSSRGVSPGSQPFVTPGSPSYELMDYNPVAEPAAVISSGNARFTVLTPALIRIEYSAKKSFEDRPTVAILNRNMPVPEFKQSVSDKVLTISTDAIELKYTIGQQFSATSLIVNKASGSSSAFSGWYYGKSDPDNLLGTIKSLDELGVTSLNCTENHHIEVHGESLHCEWGLVSRSGWAVVNDSANWGLTDGAEWWDSVNTNDIDLYLLTHGHDYPAAVADFAKLGGAVPMFPRYALGIWYTRWYDYNNLDVKKVVNRYREHNLPLDVYVTDMNWHKKDNWGGWTFDPNLYPYPKDTFGYLHKLGLHTSANLHDANGVGSYDAEYPAMCKATGFDCSTNKSIPFSIVNKTYVYALEDLVLGAVDDEFDFYWIDWQQGGTQGGAAGGKQNPTVWTNKIRVTDPKRQGKSDRGLVLARWGGLGTHRYQVGFSGDVEGLSWENLAYQPYFSVTAANVLYGYWSHDIEGPAEDHEMYTRWVQWAAYSGILRSHDRGMSGGGCAKSGGPLTGSTCSTVRPWEVPDRFYEPIRDAMLQRATLIPYIYSAARESHTSGLGLLRPMYYEFPEIDAAYNSSPTSAQYFFGPDIIVAPVTAQANQTTLLSTTSVWSPPGIWFDWTFGALHKNTADGDGTWISRDWDLNEIPILVRGGAVIPSIPVQLGDTLGLAARQYTSLTFTVVPGATSGSCEVYEDDGITRGYLTGAFVTTTASYTATDTTMTFTVASNGSYPEFPASRDIQLRLVNRPPPNSVKIDGAECSGCWEYDGPQLTVIITTPSLSTSSSEHKIEVQFAAPADQLDGLKGAFSRANLAKRNLDETRSTPGSHNTNGGRLSVFSSIGDGLSFSANSSPDDFKSAVSGAAAGFSAAIEEVNGMKLAESMPMKADANGPAPPQSALDRVARAQALLKGVALTSK